MEKLIRQWGIAPLFLAATLMILPARGGAQESAAKRRLLDHAAPSYPALARNMGLAGVVKIDVLVAPDGSVKSVEIKGGHPVLAQTAANTVRQWKWESAAHESHELVQLRFSPGE